MLSLNLALSLLLLFSCVHGAEFAFANASFLPATPFEAVVSMSSRGLGFSALARDALETLEKRQTRQCQFPGGSFCDSIHCCRPGEECCPIGCCPLGTSCETDGCCSDGSFSCGIGALCCTPGTSCCGTTSCCLPGFFCERGECIDETLKDKVVRFEIQDNNREILKNMCNGLRGKNAETLTYRGPDKAERAKTRDDAGCKSGYCARQIASGAVPANFNSCDEYPPASSLEGGGESRDEIERAINCVPSRENSHQGGKFGGLQSKLRARGINFQRGDKFVISIDCDKVLGDLVPRSRGNIGEGVKAKEQYLTGRKSSEMLWARDGEKVAMSGNETVDSDLVGLFDDDQKHSYLCAPFGDLEPGTYSAKIQVLSGSTFGGVVVDNEGFNFTANDSGVQANQSQEYMFSLQYWTPGMGVFLGTTNNKTKIKWSLDGTLMQPTPSTSLNSSPSSTGSGNGPQESQSGVAQKIFVSKYLWVAAAMATGFLALL